MKGKFDQIKHNYQEQLKQIRGDKEKVAEKNKDLEEQLNKFQGDIKEAIKIHKSLAQKEAKVEQNQKEIDQLRNEKNLLQETLDSANSKN